MGRGKVEYAGQIFEGKDLLSCGCVLENSLTAEGLSVDTLEFEVRSEDEALTQFTRNAPLKLYFDNALAGQFYVSSVARTGRYSYLFTATSAVGLLDQVTHYGGMYTGQSAKDLIDEIIGGIPHTTDQFLAMERVYGWLPVASRRDNLRQVLFAVGAVVKKAADGKLQVVYPDGERAGTITTDQMFEHPVVETGTPATAVQVTEHAYVTGGEAVTLFSGFTEQGDIIKFDAPAYNLKATGVSILASNCNYAKVSAGSCTLTGNKYFHTTRVVTQAATTGGAGAENVIGVEDATLVSLVNSANVAKRAIAYYQIGQRIKADIIAQGRKPGEIVQMPHPFGGNVEACIESLDINISSFMRAAMTAVPGFTPSSGGNNYRNMKVLTGSGTFVVPDGVKRMRVVAIGAGSGGSGGGEGGRGGSASVIVTSAEGDNGGTWSAPAGEPGRGGSGGKGGSGGRIHQAEIDVTSGQSLSYHAPSGGAGGASGASGAAGGNSVFGAVSSASGAPNDYGYADIITGVTYAVKGTDGVAGADGGKGGDAGGDGAAGKDFPPNTGGAGGTGYVYRATGYYRGVGGAGGSGAAYGVNGNKGGDGQSGGCNAGAGVTPRSAAAARSYGSGGNGGHGGSGGGSGGGIYVSKTTPGGVWTQNGGGGGGSGSAGSAGGAGCIIIYY